jgi:hypothetical protein
LGVGIFAERTRFGDSPVGGTNHSNLSALYAGGVRDNSNIHGIRGRWFRAFSIRFRTVVSVDDSSS